VRHGAALFGRTTAAVTAGVAAAIFAAIWLALPLSERRQAARGRGDQDWRRPESPFDGLHSGKTGAEPR
jgi:hypothetical protein